MTGINARLTGRTVRSSLTLVNTLVSVGRHERALDEEDDTPGRRLEAYIRGRWSRRQGGIAGLAKRIGSSTESVYAWFRGDNEPNMGHLRAVADALGVTRAELVAAMDGTEAPVTASGGASRAEVRFEAALTRQAEALETLAAAVGGSPTLRAPRPATDRDELSRRRSYWLRVARIGIGLSEAAAAQRLKLPVADVRAWEKGAAVPDDRLADVSRAYELPLEIVVEPPENDHHVVRAFRARWLTEQDRVPLGEVIRDRRAS